MEELILQLKKQIIEVLNLEDVRPEDIDENALWQSWPITSARTAPSKQG